MLGTVLAGASVVALHQKPIIHFDAFAQTNHKIDKDIVEPSTKIVVKSQLSADGKPFELVGFGPRAVTFLNLNVYVLSLYFDHELINSLKTSSHWNKEYKKQHLLDAHGWWFITDLIDRMEGEMKLIVEPSRSTTGSHMSGGFTRMLQEKLKRDEKSMSKEERAEAQNATNTFKNKFPISALNRGAILLFTKTKSTALKVEIDGKEIVTIESKWLARRFFEAYIDSEKPPSMKAKESIAEGIEEILKT